MSAWKTPLFAPYYHQTGFLHCVSETAPEKAVATMQQFRASAEQDAQLRRHLININTRRDILHHVPQFHDGPLPGWRGYLNRCAGYAQSGHALAAVHRHLCQSGVRFRLGPGNQVVGIRYEAPSADGSGAAGRTARGVETANGAFYPARLLVVAAGAWAAQLVPELGPQVVARCWSVAHVQLTDDEASALRGIPVTYARDLGFFFEPDPGTKLLKLCPMGAGIVNTDSKTGVSLPPGDLSRSAFMPGDDEGKLRRLLAHTLLRWRSGRWSRGLCAGLPTRATPTTLSTMCPGRGPRSLSCQATRATASRCFPLWDRGWRTCCVRLMAGSTRPVGAGKMRKQKGQAVMGETR